MISGIQPRKNVLTLTLAQTAKCLQEVGSMALLTFGFLQHVKQIT